MCGRFALYSSLDDLLREFDVQQSTLASWKPRYNIAPTQSVVVVTQRQGTTRLEEMRWGLIPFWAKDESVGSRLINARAETVDSKPSFKHSLRGRRCLVLANGFFEWQKVNGAKVPHYIRLKSKQPFGMAGLYDVWDHPSGESVTTCTIVTTRANALLEPVHGRMPVVLSVSNRGLWLQTDPVDTGRLLTLLEPYSGSEMELYPVSRLVNSPANDVPEIVQPLSA